MGQFHLLRTRRFLPFFLTQFCGAFNDNFFKNALLILIAYRTTAIWGVPAAQMVAAAGGIFILPFFLFSTTAGQLADKYDKAKLTRLVKLVEIALMLGAAAGFLFHRPEWLLLILFGMGMHSAFFGPVKYSLIPQVLRKEELVGGNALVSGGTFLAILLGTLTGGILVVLEPHGTWLVSAGLVGVAVLGWLASRAIPASDPVDPALRFAWNPLPAAREIFRLALATRSVFLSILGISWFWFFGLAFLSLFPPYCKEWLGASPYVATLFLSTFSVGIAAGSVLCERLSRKRVELGLVPFGSLGMTLFAVDLFLVGKPAFTVGAASLGVAVVLSEPQGIRIVADLFLISVFSGFYIVPLNSFVQKRAEPAHRSRIIAANNILNALFMVLASMLLMVMIARKLTPPQMFLVIGVANAVVAVAIYTVVPEFFLRFLVWCFTSFIYRLRVTGEDHIPDSGAAILVCNHVSYVDWAILAAGVPRPPRFIMYHRFAKGMPRLLVRHAKLIPIAPAGEDAALMEEAFERAAKELREGELVCLFPEGKITRDGTLNTFKTGVERLVRETPVPVIPMAITNLWGSFFSREGGGALRKPPRKLWARVGLRIGAPVPPEQVTATLLRERVQALLDGRS